MGNRSEEDSGSLFDVKSGSLKPLVRIDLSDNETTVVFDLPYVRKEDVSVTSTDDVLRIEAKTRQPVSVRVGGSLQRHLQFRKYALEIRLPLKVDPNHADARFRRGLLIIRYPIIKEGNKVEVE